MSNVKLFADDTSLLFVVRHVDSSAAELYNDLAKISNRVHYWKMSFSAGSIKQDQDFIFNRNVNKDPHLPSTFDNNIVYQATQQKQRVLYLAIVYQLRNI